MALLFISEYIVLADAGGRSAQAPQEPALNQTPVDFSGGVAPSAAFAATTRFISMISDTDCYVVFGTAPVAVTQAGFYLPAKREMVRGVPQGASYKVSVIQ